MFSFKSLGTGFIAGIALLLFGLFQPVSADTVDVSIPGFSFDPASVTISQGTTVKWTNNHTISHTSTSDSSVWDSGTINSGASFSYTFNTVGTFPYHCSFHPTMLGTVTVAPPNHIPTTTPYGIIILIALIIIAAVMTYRRRRRTATS